jgi:hypothetical protein
MAEGGENGESVSAQPVMDASSWARWMVLSSLAGLAATGPQTGFAGLTNEWTKPTSGYWEETNYWSLNTLPSIALDGIVFANEGYKALAIGPGTTANHSNSLWIKNLTVDRPSNLLLLNYAGMNVPLRIASDFVLSGGSFLLSYYSSLNASNFYCSGRATFAELSVATFKKLQVSAVPPASAELVISNAVISTETLYLGVLGATGRVGIVNQYGGTMQATGTDSVNVLTNSIYNLQDGTLLARRINVYGGAVPYNFRMSGGRLEVSDGLWMSTAGFQLHGGELQAPEIGVVAGPFTHTGGRNTVGYLGIAYWGWANYLLSGGTLISSNVSVGRWDGFGTFDQSGGVHTNSGRIRLEGYERTGHHGVFGRYILSSGFLGSPKLDVFGGSVAQSGGTNLAGDVVLDSYGAYRLTGGTLESSNLFLVATNGDGVTAFTPCLFVHTNGVNTVKNQLIINDDPNSYYYYHRTRGGLYQLDGGTLNSHFVDVRDQFVHSGGLHSND